MRVEYINPFVETAFNILQEVLGGEVRRGDLYLKSTSMPVMGVAALVGLAGDVEGRVLFDMTMETAMNIASTMNGEKLTEFDALAKATVTELAKVCMALSESGSWRKYSSVYLDTLTHENAPPTELTNPNRLVRFYSGCFGIATGSVGAAQYCGAFIAKRGSTTYLAIVAGLPDSASRFALASEMLDYGFSAYRAVEIGSQSLKKHPNAKARQGCL